MKKSTSENRVLKAGTKFKILREFQGLSIDNVSKQSQVKAKTIKKFEGGTSADIAASDLFRLCEQLDIPFDILVGCYDPSLERVSREHAWQSQLYISCLENIDSRVEAVNAIVATSDILNIAEILYLHSSSTPSKMVDDNFANLLVSRLILK